MLRGGLLSFCIAVSIACFSQVGLQTDTTIEAYRDVEEVQVKGKLLTPAMNQVSSSSFTLNVKELQALPGIGETLSQLIISERENNGNFYYPEDLTAVKGIGMKKLEMFRDLLDFSEGGD